MKAKAPPPSGLDPSWRKLRLEKSEVQQEILSSILEVDLEKSSGFISAIRDIKLNDTILGAIEAYEEVGDRNAFIWKWVRKGVEITSLSCIDEELWDHVCDTKTLGVMFDVLLDDIADVGGDSDLLEKHISITDNRPASFEGRTTEERQHYECSLEVWKRIWKRLESYPRFEQYRDVLEYDYRQLMNSMRYSVLIQNHPAIMNMPEHDAYFPHNMHMMISGTIDLMASSQFDENESGHLRRILAFAQYMGRIGNLVTTWEREIREKDFSSGVFALALSLGALEVKDLIEGQQEFICKKIRNANIEIRFLARWKKLHDRIVASASRLNSVDISKLVSGLETLIQLHLGSRGLK